MWSSSDDLDSLLLLGGFESDSDSWLSEGFDSTIFFPFCSQLLRNPSSILWRF